MTFPSLYSLFVWWVFFVFYMFIKAICQFRIPPNVQFVLSYVFFMQNMSIYRIFTKNLFSSMGTFRITKMQRNGRAFAGGRTNVHEVPRTDKAIWDLHFAPRNYNFFLYLKKNLAGKNLLKSKFKKNMILTKAVNFCDRGIQKFVSRLKKIMESESNYVGK